MMGVKIDYLGRAVDTHDRIIWSTYGSDGYDPQCLTLCTVRWLSMTPDELKSQLQAGRI